MLVKHADGLCERAIRMMKECRLPSTCTRKPLWAHMVAGKPKGAFDLLVERARRGRPFGADGRLERLGKPVVPLFAHTPQYLPFAIW
jgi:hypothetical protein